MDPELVVLQRERLREWIALEKKLQALKREMSECKGRHKELMRQITETMRENNLDDYDIHKGQIMRKTQKRRQNLSKKYLIEQLHTYYADDPEEADHLVHQLMENRARIESDKLELFVDDTDS
jgi:predicted component of type VI protein secretion system